MAKLLSAYLMAFAALAVFMVGDVRAQQFDYSEYDVVEGDTLWSISSGELEDPFQWPKIWHQNPDIENPDLIFPGQKIKIPTGLKSQGEVALPDVPIADEGLESAKDEAAPTKVVKKKKKQRELKSRKLRIRKKDYLISKLELTAIGYIADDKPNTGKVVESPFGNTLYGPGREIYLKTKSGVSVGDKFYTVIVSQKVNHPKNGKFLGWLIERTGLVQIEKITDSHVIARVLEAYTEISDGDLLDTYVEIDPPYVIDPPRKPQMINGYVVATKFKKVLSGQMDLVFLDIGTEKGIEAGDILMSITAKTDTRPNGTIQIVKADETTSAALILKSEYPISKGDKIAGHE